MPKFAASLSDEEFPSDTWDTLEEAVEAQNKELEEGTRFFVCEVRPLCFKELFDFDVFVENMQYSAEDNAGEASEGYLEDMKVEDQEDLINHIDKWFTDHGYQPTFWAADEVKEFIAKK